jgi:hypothetical protein
VNRNRRHVEYEERQYPAHSENRGQCEEHQKSPRATLRRCCLALCARAPYEDQK